MNSITRKEIADGVFFSSVKDSRFKTMRIRANIIVPLSEKTASSYALLCGVLSHSCKAYPDFTVLSKKLSALYGADLSTGIRKVGDSQVLSIIATGLDDRYAFDGESIARELSILLCNVIFNPNVSDCAFNSEELEQERRQLLDLIDSEFNDKRTYANEQLIKNMCANEVFGIKRYGSAEKIKEITTQSLYNDWLTLLKTAKFEILYIGDTSADKACEVFTQAFESVERTPVATENKIVKKAEKVNRVCEEMELSQSKLVMGFRTETALPDKDVNAAILMCSVLGGTANSKLFCNVREKQSLCYYCSSRYNQSKGILIIDSGVEGDNIEKAEQGILKEIENMKNGDISDFELSSAKLAIINSLRSSNDTVGGIDSWYSNRLLQGDLKSVEEVADEINAVTKEEVIVAAQRLTLDTIYVLKNN